MKEVFHMGIYAEKRKSHLNSSDVKSAVAQSAMPAADYMSPLGGAASPELGDSLRSRIQQNFLDNQNAAAEAEADKYAESISAGAGPQEVKEQLGQKMGADFSSITFHTDSAAKQNTDAIGASAYTTGKDVYFNEGFDPTIAAHELVHTVQQGQVSADSSTVSVQSGDVQMFPWSRKKGGPQKAVARTALPDMSEYQSGAMVPNEEVMERLHSGFAMRQENGSNYANMMGPVLDPLQQAKGDYIKALMSSGMNMSKAADLKEYRANALGKTSYNADTVHATKGILSMMSEYMKQQNVKDSIAELTAAHDNNWESRLRNHGEITPEAKQSYMIKNFMCKGFGTVPQKGLDSNDPEKSDFIYRGIMTNLGNAEGLYGRKDDEDFPEELKDLMAAYAPVRQQFIDAMNPQAAQPAAAFTPGEKTSDKTIGYRSDKIGAMAAQGGGNYDPTSSDPDQINLGLRLMHDRIKNPREGDTAEEISARKRAFAEARARQLDEEFRESQAASQPAPAKKKKWWQFWK